MKVVLIAQVPSEQVEAIAAVDPRIEVEDAWELFGPELVADWPDQTVSWYLPRHFPALVDTPEQRRERDSMLAEAEVICVTFPFPTRLAGRAPKLRLVHQIPAGVSNLVRGDLWRTNIPVTSGRGAGGTLPIAEWALAMVYILAKDIPRAFSQRAAGRFERAEFQGGLVTGKTLAVVGLGGIGRQVARLASAVGMRVIGTRRSSEPVDHVERLYPPSELHAVLGESDFVVLASQLTAESHHLIDAAALAAMRPGAFLINVARGELIDETALLDALRSGHLGGFAADVYAGEFDHQPPPALVALDNVIITPHTSGQAEGYPPGPFEILRENLRRLLDQQPLINRVDWDRGY